MKQAREKEEGGEGEKYKRRTEAERVPEKRRDPRQDLLTRDLLATVDSFIIIVRSRKIREKIFRAK